MLSKGTVEILTALEKREMRFHQLAKIKVDSKRINRRTLSLRLKMLEEKLLIQRRVVKGRPPYTEYSLTIRGQQLLPHLKELQRT